MKKTNKYLYWLLIQQNYGFGWEDVSEYEATSVGQGIEQTEITRTGKDGQPKRVKIPLWRHDFKEYAMNGATRCIFRKEPNPDFVQTPLKYLIS